MKWLKRVICGSTHHEYRDENGIKQFFEIEVNPMSSSEKIRLYDLRDMPATYYVGFKDVRHAKKIAIESLTDVKVLEPFYDKEWYERSARTTKLIEDTEALLISLKSLRNE